MPSRASRPPNGATTFGERPESAGRDPIISSPCGHPGKATRPMSPGGHRHSRDIGGFTFSIVTRTIALVDDVPKPQSPSTTVVVGDPERCSMCTGDDCPTFMRSMSRDLDHPVRIMTARFAATACRVASSTSSVSVPAAIG